MINQCLIQFEQKSYDKFISNARHVLFADFDFVLESDIVYSMYFSSFFKTDKLVNLK